MQPAGLDAGSANTFDNTHAKSRTPDNTFDNTAMESDDLEGSCKCAG